jgi:A/G-specific adenine glycosylase
MRSFTNILLKWFDTEKRDLPWKHTRDPYKIWISEIILQQTRVEQGTPYYYKFISRFPTIKDLAEADEDLVLKMWEGLGYYSRARNLHHTSKILISDYNGIFPDTYDEIIKLKGIGPYTAAAILSFAFNKSYPVVDGNVLRIVSRYLGSFEPIDVPQNQKNILTFLQKQIDPKRPGDFNQAMMDLGSMVCTPKLYKCGNCPLSNLCKSNADHLQSELPVKSKKIVKKDRFFHYLVFKTNKDEIFIKRRQNDIWIGLYDFPLIEKGNNTQITKKELLGFLSSLDTNLRPLKVVTKTIFDKHLLTHLNLYTTFYTIDIESFEANILKKEFILVSRKNIAKFAFPKIVNSFLEKTFFNI